MTQKNILTYLLSFIGYVVIQSAFLNKMLIANTAFCFFYTGFLLFLPPSNNRISQLIIGFLIGLLIDVFGDTLGVHAISCVFLMFIRPIWLQITLGDLGEGSGFINYKNVSGSGLIIYALPLLLIHHSIVFVIDAIGVGIGFRTFAKIVSSVLFSFFMLFTIQLFVSPSSKKS